MGKHPHFSASSCHQGSGVHTCQNRRGCPFFKSSFRWYTCPTQNPVSSKSKPPFQNTSWTKIKHICSVVKSIPASKPRGIDPNYRFIPLARKKSAGSGPWLPTQENGITGRNECWPRMNNAQFFHGGSEMWNQSHFWTGPNLPDS